MKRRRSLGCGARKEVMNGFKQQTIASALRGEEGLPTVWGTDEERADGDTQA